MIRIVFSSLVSIGIWLSVAATVFAQSIPQEVLDPYRAYLKAEDTGDYSAAMTAAKEAYEAGEKYLGEHKTTGDLAQNYADIWIKVDFKNSEILKVYERSADLAKLYQDDPVGTEIQRRIKTAQIQPLVPQNKIGLDAIRTARKVIDENDLKGSTYDGEVKTLEAKYLYASGKRYFALPKIREAIAVLESPSDNLRSIFYQLQSLSLLNT